MTTFGSLKTLLISCVNNWRGVNKSCIKWAHFMLFHFSFIQQSFKQVLEEGKIFQIFNQNNITKN